MKKKILTALILITTANQAYAANFFDELDFEELKFKPPKVEELKEPPAEIKLDPLQETINKINLLNDDEEKIKIWASFTEKKNYLIINKKECAAFVYDKDNKQITKFEIGVGREIGDELNDTLGKSGKAKNTTPAGEYTLIVNVTNPSAYGDLTFSLGDKANKVKNTKKVVALHKVPKFRQKERLKKFNDGNISNNRMSHGCINFLEKDFTELRKYISGGLKVFVLPEEKDNHLILKKNEKGEFELAQSKY